jgi:DNA-binding GntR family transcriptional regulator
VNGWKDLGHEARAMTVPRIDAAAPPLEEGAGTMAERVYRRLAQRLMSGALAPGDRLSLRATAESLGVSMMPVREAVSRLAAEKALIVEPKRAVAVPVMSAAQFRDLTRTRIAVEGAAAAMAAESADPRAIRELAASEAAFRAATRARAPDTIAAVGLNQAFHFALYRASASSEMLSIVERLWLRAGPVINLDLRGNTGRLRFGGAARHHAAILAAVRERDASAARAALAADIKGAADYILSQGRLPD